MKTLIKIATLCLFTFITLNVCAQTTGTTNVAKTSETTKRNYKYIGWSRTKSAKPLLNILRVKVLISDLDPVDIISLDESIRDTVKKTEGSTYIYITYWTNEFIALNFDPWEKQEKRKLFYGIKLTDIEIFNFMPYESHNKMGVNFYPSDSINLIFRCPVVYEEWCGNQDCEKCGFVELLDPPIINDFYLENGEQNLFMILGLRKVIKQTMQMNPNFHFSFPYSTSERIKNDGKSLINCSQHPNEKFGDAIENKIMLHIASSYQGSKL